MTAGKQPLHGPAVYDGPRLSAQFRLVPEEGKVIIKKMPKDTKYATVVKVDDESHTAILPRALAAARQARLAAGAAAAAAAAAFGAGVL